MDMPTEVEWACGIEEGCIRWEVGLNMEGLGGRGVWVVSGYSVSYTNINYRKGSSGGSV